MTLTPVIICFCFFEPFPSVVVAARVRLGKHRNSRIGPEKVWLSLLENLAGIPYRKL